MKLSGSPTRDIRGGHTTPTEAETKATVPGGVHPILNSGPCDLISSLIYSNEKHSQNSGPNRNISTQAVQLVFISITLEKLSNF